MGGTTLHSWRDVTLAAPKIAIPSLEPLLPLTRRCAGQLGDRDVHAVPASTLRL